jgi:hypothetical protein
VSRWLIAAALPLLMASTPIELAVHVALDADGAPIADAAWIDAQVQSAAGHLGDADIALTWHDAGDGGIAGDVITVADRNALATAAADGASVPVFVVPRLADKDVEDGWLNGVHWRYGGDDEDLRGRRYVILSHETRWSSTLAHELGHFFGLAHTENADGLMTTRAKRSSDAPTLDGKQLRRVKARAKAWARRARRKA